VKFAHFLTLGILFFAAASASAQVYKCQKENGVIAFQEKPCARGTLLKKIPIGVGKSKPKPPAPKAPAPAIPPSDAAANPPPAPLTNLTIPAPPTTTSAVTPSGTWFQCTDPAGNSYYTLDPYPKRHYVLLSGVKNWPSGKAPQTIAPGAKAWVLDQCVAADSTAACADYASRVEFAQALVNKGGADVNKNKRELGRLKAIYKHRCGK
jgi:hypothetical protein